MNFSTPIQERLIRFPNLFFQAYEFRVGDASSFDKNRFFNALFESRTFHNDFVGHRPEGARPSNKPGEDRKSDHGPFAIETMRPSHYNEVSFGEATREVRSRVDTSADSADDPSESWYIFPDPPASGQRLNAYLEQVGRNNPRCFKLSLTILEATDDTFSEHFSEFHKMTGGILWHFEEWVTYAEANREAHLFFLAYD